MNRATRTACRFGQAAALLCLFLSVPAAQGLDHQVATTAEFASALAAAQSGDVILLAPGDYAGGHYRSGLSGVTIRSQDPADRARIIGGANGIQLSDATSVVLEDLVFEQQTGNGLNIDDGGSFGTPSTDITIRRVAVRSMAATGNNDGIKLSGVTGFVIDQVEVRDWGAGGSAVDPVGCHRGLIQNSTFVSSVAAGGSAVRPKGGSKDITIRANYIELPAGIGRGVQAGGSTGAPFFRFVDGDSGYEADEITVEGNVILGGSSAVSWVNIDGGVFHHNYVIDPGDWAFRILNENVGQPIVETQNGVLADNVIAYRGDSWRRAGNFDGPGVLEESFGFRGNHWINADNPTTAGSTPTLPVAETDGVYGGAAPFTTAVQTWRFEWGLWVVAPGAGPPSFEGVTIDEHHALLRAAPGDDAVFNPLADNPLSGGWSLHPLNGPDLTDVIGNQVVLVNPRKAGIPAAAGDYDRNGVIDMADYALWRAQYGVTGSALADGNDDGRVDAADYTLWRDAFAGESGAHLVPCPGASTLGIVPMFAAARSRAR
ncbi:hypothetical protein KOR34_28300 [Posidoniimonas corsicana]|uniref:Probable pectate lyase C n=1 Tax=Posidoniimonas corsicana TaxID=1938618 RepID=A0A5C5VGS3_9BACT|nr:right-handed parallel beta-helix repeat-containing protein [Posidoniimonas corsicana]TWT37864.1 hypothetical protein KOR34_28300 [Posidoniimonas corsicana]